MANEIKKEAIAENIIQHKNANATHNENWNFQEDVLIPMKQTLHIIDGEDEFNSLIGETTPLNLSNNDNNAIVNERVGISEMKDQISKVVALR
jgi:hypothetical protein